MVLQATQHWTNNDGQQPSPPSSSSSESASRSQQPTQSCLGVHFEEITPVELLLPDILMLSRTTNTGPIEDHYHHNEHRTLIDKRRSP
jgi:hypothetical protein